MLIQLLLFILSLLLLLIGYCLVFKSNVVLQFLNAKDDLPSILSDYGKFFIIGGILKVGILGNR